MLPSIYLVIEIGELSQVGGAQRHYFPSGEVHSGFSGHNGAMVKFKSWYLLYGSKLLLSMERIIKPQGSCVWCNCFVAVY